jgi:hypothetical protein
MFSSSLSRSDGEGDRAAKTAWWRGPVVLENPFTIGSSVDGSPPRQLRS